MATISDNTVSAAQPAVASYSAAGTFLEGLAAQDFTRLGSALSDRVRLRALLPGGPKAWDGADQVTSTFTAWFGDVDDFELVDATIGEVGSRLHLRWRVRVRAERLGEGWFVVEQQAYADTDDHHRLDHISLLCTGYCPEKPRG
jgi:hypothetical protein